MSSTEEKVLKQFEFYFSDSNLPNDKFLRSQVANNLEGYVSLDVLCAFKRIQDLTKDVQLVISALSKSKMLEVDSEGKNVRRTTPLPETNSMNQKTVYVKGLPSDSTIESVESLFNGFKVTCVRLRRNKETREFKGSAFVEFATEEEVSKAVESKYEGLTVIAKKDYDASKQLERVDRKNKERKEKYGKEMEETRKKYFILPGVIVKVTGMGKKDDQKGDSLKEKFNQYGEVAYVEYPLPHGKELDYTLCYVRFKDAESAAKMAKDFSENKIVLGGESPCVAVNLDEKQEEEYVMQLVIRNIEKRGKKRKNSSYKGNKRTKRE